MHLNCIIIDDEPLARKGLKEYIEDSMFLVLAGEFEHPLNAMNILSTEHIDLVFLDIQMPKLTGIEFIRSLQNPPLIVFTTAYPQYALEGFDLNAVDYLLKPFSFDRFLKAAFKAKSILEGKNTNDKQASSNSSGYFFIKTDNKLQKISFNEVLFIESLQNYVAIYTSTKKYISYLTLKSLELQLPANQFVKIHKSYIVSSHQVDSIEGNDVKIGTHTLPISRTSREEVLDKILQDKLLKR